MTEGKHRGGYKYRNRRYKSSSNNNSGNKKPTFLASLITTIAGAIVKDLTSKDSKIKNLTKKLFKSKKIEKEKTQYIDANCEVLEDDKNK